jgi:hypothetical protein
MRIYRMILRWQKYCSVVINMTAIALENRYWPSNQSLQPMRPAAGRTAEL